MTCLHHPAGFLNSCGMHPLEDDPQALISLNLPLADGAGDLHYLLSLYMPLHQDRFDGGMEKFREFNDSIIEPVDIGSGVPFDLKRFA